MTLITGEAAHTGQSLMYALYALDEMQRQGYSLVNTRSRWMFIKFKSPNLLPQEGEQVVRAGHFDHPLEALANFGRGVANTEARASKQNKSLSLGETASGK